MLYNTIPDIIVDTDTGIEFYGANTVSKEILISILKNFKLGILLSPGPSMGICSAGPASWQEASVTGHASL